MGKRRAGSGAPYSKAPWWRASWLAWLILVTLITWALWELWFNIPGKG